MFLIFRLINLILSEDNFGDSLGLSDLTTESLLAKMEDPVVVPACGRINQKLPLGTASSWDAATGKTRAPRPRYGGLNREEATRMLLSSPLPNEMCVGAMPVGSHVTAAPGGVLPVPPASTSAAAAYLFQRPHTTVTKAISDPYVQYLQQQSVITTNLGKKCALKKSFATSFHVIFFADNLSLNDRRKLESEDSSYGSDHENTQRWTNHDDVSRTASETLGVEFTEYVNAKELISDHYECLEDLFSDKTYKKKVEYAFKLGYTEQQLQQAVLKLGRKAGEDQILEELIRLQKTTKSDPLELAVPDIHQSCDLKSPRLNDSVSQVKKNTFLKLILCTNF